ncbi:MAG: ABC transporter transmembrane domain-containing protein, partial [Verrucomicrobiota bacterium]
MPDFRQHDVTDCGAACLAYVFHRHGLRMSLSALRQRAGTHRSGTTALGLVDTARSLGFEAKGVRCKLDDLRGIPLPGIAHVLTDNGRSHYVVLCDVGKKRLRVMDPAIGRVEKWPIERFRAAWTNVFIILAPAIDFQPSNKTESAWSRLMRLLRPQKAVLTQAFIGVVLTTLLSLSSAIYIQKIVDNVIVDGNRNLLRLLGTAMFLILGAQILIGYFQSILLLRSAQRIDAGLMLGYYRHLMRLPQSFFDTMRVGEITSRVRDAVAIRDFLNGTILNLILNPLILLVALAAMFAYSWRLAVFSLLLIPANAVIYFASDWLNRRYQREIMERSADFDSQMVESLHAMSVVRSCGMEDEMTLRTETRLVRLLKRVWTAGRAEYAIGSIGGFVTQAYSIGLLWIGASLVLDSHLTAGELMSCNALAGYITGPIVALLGMNASIRGATTATDRLYEILDLEREQDEGIGELHLDEAFTLSFENVSFRYPGRVATLRDLSLEFASGTITALVGRSGCGKTTILGLAQRHYESEGGRIRLAGVDLKQIRLSALRQHIAFVPQKIDLLAGTVLENLAPNELQPDIQRITELCEEVGILEFIEGLPRGFQTLIHENGANLSGGQKQRLAVVRALYADAPVVLMDEPSSALDIESEEMLIATLRRMRADGKLVILALHNQRLLSLCDHVVRLEEGQVVGRDGFKPDAEAEPSRLVRLSEAAAREETGVDETVAGGRRGCTMWTPETAGLHASFRERAGTGILIGQTDANVMGVREDGKGWILEEGRCDLFEVTGRQPGVFGFDIGPLGGGWVASCGHLVPRIREAHGHGGVILVSWHPENFATGGDLWTGCGVADLLPGAPAHAALRERLDLIADNLGNLTDSEGHSIPLLFHCWHQQNADHFWWGRSRCTAREYRRLFRATVSYLREHRRVGNFVFCWTPGAGTEPFAECLDRYPGHDVVDVVGLDWFGSDRAESSRCLVTRVAEAVRFARAHGKVVGLTEVGFSVGPEQSGLAHCKDPAWLRTRLFEPLLGHPEARQIAFLCFWRNEGHNPGLYHSPPPGSLHADCLAQLAEDPRLHFAEDRGFR